METFDLFKTTLIALFAYLSYKKLTGRKNKTIAVCGYVVFPAFVLAWSSPYVVQPLNSIVVIISLSITIAVIEKQKFKHCFFYFGISYAVSYVLYTISNFISSVILVILFSRHGVDIWFILFIFAFKSLFMFLIYQVKFKTAINANITNAGTTTVGIVLILYGILRDDRTTTMDFLLPFSGIILCGLGLYWWIKKESVDTLKEKQNEKQNAKLQAAIDHSSKVCLSLEKALHTSSKKLPAYQGAVENLIAQIENPTVRQKALNTLREVNTSALAEFSQEITWEVEKTAFPTTEIALVDAIIDFYRRRAILHGIDFELSIDGDIRKITEIILQSQLETLLSNLLDNAIIAVKRSGTSDGRITARLWESGLSVEDNGEPFRESVLADLPRCKETLIPDEESGGGIGFATMFEITNECRASLEITESNGIKSVTVRFDGENRIVIGKAQD
jgi:signal transduction histidine kinase